MSEFSFYLVAAGAAAVILIGGLTWFLVRWLTRPTATPQEPVLSKVDVASLSIAPPARDRIRVDLYNVPVRLSAIVVASAGRDDTLPTDISLLLDRACPGLERVYKLDKPSVIRWPPQLSTQGFARSFFMNAPLPGDQGKGTPWCSVAGRIEDERASALVGMIFRGATANSLGQIVVERSTQWLDVLRVRHDLDTQDFEL